MSLRVNTNIAALDTQRYVQQTTDALSNSMQKLSSGLRINKAADDAAGLGIAEKMKGQIVSLEQAQRNANDGVSLVQTAEGVLGTVNDILTRVRELAVQFNSGTLSTSDKAAITAEVTALGSQVQAIGANTQFNGISLLTGSTTITLAVGASQAESLGITVTLLYGNATGGVDSNIFTFSTSGTVTLASIDTAIQNVSQLRGNLGAVQNRLGYMLQSLANYHENLSASESQIMDVDVAAEMSNFTKLQIMQQSGISMLSQANQSPQAALKLLQ